MSVGDRAGVDDRGVRSLNLGGVVQLLGATYRDDKAEQVRLAELAGVAQLIDISGTIPDPPVTPSAGWRFQV